MRLSHAKQIWQHFGLRWLAYRVWYAFRLRAGFVRRGQPATEWEKRPFSSFLTRPHLADPDSYLAYRQTKSPPLLF